MRAHASPMIAQAAIHTFSGPLVLCLVGHHEHAVGADLLPQPGGGGGRGGGEEGMAGAWSGA